MGRAIAAALLMLCLAACEAKPPALDCTPSAECALRMAQKLAAHDGARHPSVYASSLSLIASYVTKKEGASPRARAAWKAAIAADQTARKTVSEMAMSAGAFADAVAIAAAIENADERDATLIEISEAAADDGKIAEALSAAGYISLGEKRERAQLSIVRRQMLANPARPELAREAAGQLGELKPRADAIIAIAAKAADDGGVEAARAELASAPDGESRAAALDALALKLREARRWDEFADARRAAIPFARAQKDSVLRSIYLRLIANDLSEIGKYDEALALTDDMDNEHRADALREIAVDQAWAGDYQGAAATAGKISPVDGSRDDARADIAAAKIARGEATPAEAFAGISVDPQTQSEALLAAAQILEEHGPRAQASLLLSTAAAAAARGKDDRDGALSAIGIEQADFGLTADARETADMIIGRAEKFDVLTALGAAFAETGAFADARKTFDLATKIGSGLDADTRATVPVAQAQYGMPADGFINARALPKSPGRLSALSEVAAGFAKKGDAANAFAAVGELEKDGYFPEVLYLEIYANLP